MRSDRAVLSICAVVAACATTGAQKPVTTFVTEAEAWSVRCEAYATANAQDLTLARLCAARAKDAMDPAYRTVRDTVHLQRGTRMYLEKYYATWSSALVSESLSGHASMEQRSDLRALRDKLLGE